MNAKKDLIDLADSLNENMDYLRTILTAAEDKIRFYFSDKALLGPHRELLSLYIAELGSLLGLAERFLDGMGEDMRQATGALCEIDLPCGAK